MVVSGRGTQMVGVDALDVGAGDICFIPRNTPHRITGTSTEDLVILWAFGGAASLEQAGYVPLPDDVKGAESSEIRTEPLTPEEITRYHDRGFLFPIRVLDDAQVERAREALDDHLEGRRESKTYELTDPIVDADHGQATVGSGTASAVVETTGGRSGNRTRCPSSSTCGSATTASGRSTPTPSSPEWRVSCSARRRSS